MKHLNELKELLEEQLKKITKKGDITVSELDSVYKVIDIIKDIGTIEAMEEYGGEGEYSQRGYSGRMNMGSYDGRGMSNRGSYNGSSNRGSYNSYDNSYDGRRGRDADSDGRYSEEYSERRGRNSRNSYNSYNGGSYDYSGDKEQMMSTLEQMMEKASNEKERQAIMQCIEKLES